MTVESLTGRVNVRVKVVLGATRSSTTRVAARVPDVGEPDAKEVWISRRQAQALLVDGLVGDVDRVVGVGLPVGAGHDRENLRGRVPLQLVLGGGLDRQSRLHRRLVHGLGELDLERSVEGEAAVRTVGIGLGSQGREGRQLLTRDLLGGESQKQEAGHGRDRDAHHENLHCAEFDFACGWREVRSESAWPSQWPLLSARVRLLWRVGVTGPLLTSRRQGNTAFRHSANAPRVPASRPNGHAGDAAMTASGSRESVRSGLSQARRASGQECLPGCTGRKSRSRDPSIRGASGR